MRSSCAIRARNAAISIASFSARSAAVAWSASGRSRLRTSSSTSFARSTWIRDAGELELGPVLAALELAEPGRLLDEVAPVLRLRGEHRVDLALRDDRVHRAAEADVGEQLDEIGAAHRRLVDEVLPLAATHEPARDRDLAEVDLVAEAAVRVVEDELDLAVIGGGRFAAPPKRTSSGFSARSSDGRQRAGGPDDRVGDVRLAGAVRADDHGHARLELELDRVDERLEAADLDRLEMHVRRTLTAGADVVVTRTADEACAR